MGFCQLSGREERSFCRILWEDRGRREKVQRSDRANNLTSGARD